MGFRERFPGWHFPVADDGTEATPDLNEAQQVIASAIPCPACGALVAAISAQRHIDWHKTQPSPPRGPTPSA